MDEEVVGEIIFKPKHNWFAILSLGILIILLGGAFFVRGVVAENIFTLILGSVILVIGVVSIIGRSRLIILRNHEAIVKRLLFPDLVLKYENFTDIWGEMIRFGNRGIPLKFMINSQELVDTLVDMLKQRNISPKDRYVAEVSLTNKAVKYSLIPSILLAVIFTQIFRLYLDIQLNAFVVGPIIFLVLLYGIYFILKRKE